MSELYDSAFVITPSDDNDLVKVTNGIYIGYTGDIKVDTASGDEVVFYAVPAGVILPLQLRKVYADTTTASGLLGLL